MEMAGNLNQKYYLLEQLFKDKKDLDEIMSHIENTGITPEGAKTDFYKDHDLPSPPLMLAVKYRRTDMMNSLIQKGFDPHTPYTRNRFRKERRYYLIHGACLSGDITLIKVLVEEQKVDIHVVGMSERMEFQLVDVKHYTTIMHAMDAGIDTDKKLQIVKYLVQKGADVGHSPDLAVSVDRREYEISEYLITCGGNLNKNPQVYHPRSPLQYAAKNRNVKIAKKLVDAGASIAGIEGTTFLNEAVSQDHIEMVDYAISLGIDIYCDKRHGSALNLAALIEAYKVTRYLVVDQNVNLDVKSPRGKTAFYLALNEMNNDLVQLFIKAGYNPYSEIRFCEAHGYVGLEKLTRKALDSIARRTLQDLCVFQVRRSLGRNANQKVELLSLPAILKKMVKLDNIPRYPSTPLYYL